MINISKTWSMLTFSTTLILAGCVLQTKNPVEFEEASKALSQTVAVEPSLVANRLSQFAAKCWDNTVATGWTTSGVVKHSFSFGLRGGVETSNGTTRLILMQARLEQGLFGSDEIPWAIMLTSKIQPRDDGKTDILTSRVFNYAGMENKIARWATGETSDCD